MSFRRAGLAAVSRASAHLASFRSIVPRVSPSVVAVAAAGGVISTSAVAVAPRRALAAQPQPAAQTPRRLSDDELKPFLEMAIEAKTKAYSPYSKFRVGALLIGNDGKLYTGCNVENASYGLTICAERTALTKAVSEGTRSFSTIIISTDVVDSWLPPCGACRQFIAEFGLDIEVILVKPDRTFKRLTAEQLLPGAFTAKDLDATRL